MNVKIILACLVVLTYHVAVESLAINETIAMKVKLSTGRPTTRYTTRRTTRYTTHRPTPPPKVYCYTCSMQTCPLPFTSHNVPTFYSPNRWCIRSSFSPDTNATAERGIDEFNYCYYKGYGCRWDAFDFICISIDITNFILCLVFICIVAYQFNRIMIMKNVPRMISINIICVNTVGCLLRLGHMSIPTLFKDLHIITQFKETLFCRLRGYILWSLFGITYWTYVLLAFYRFVRVIFPTKIWLRQSSLYFSVLLPGHLIFVFLIFLPLILFFDGIHQIPGEIYCSIISIPIYAYLYTCFIIFFMPINIVCVFYVCIAQKIRRLSIKRQRQCRRDYIVIRRLVFTMFILTIIIIPCTIVCIQMTNQHDFHPNFHRMLWVLLPIVSCLFIITLPIIITQLRHI